MRCAVTIVSMISWATIITEYIPSYVQYMCTAEPLYRGHHLGMKSSPLYVVGPLISGVVSYYGNVVTQSISVHTLYMYIILYVYVYNISIKAHYITAHNIMSSVHV